MNALLERFDRHIARPIADWLDSVGIGQTAGAILGGALLLFLLIVLLRRASKPDRAQTSATGEPPPTPEPPPTREPPPRLTTCPACDGAVSVNALSCPRCGEPFAPAAAPDEDMTVRCRSCDSTSLVVRQEGTGCLVAFLVGFLVFVGFLCIVGPFAVPLAFVTSLLMILLDGKRDVRCCQQCGTRTPI